jgi:pyruvate-formate lyase-activating enzyme
MNDNDYTFSESSDMAQDIADEKRAAMSYVSEAFAEAQLDGLDPDCLAQAALFAAFRELVITYGEDASAEYAESLAERIRAGGFSTALRH